MPYAIIRTGGKQYRVSAGDRLKVEKIEAEIGQEVALSDVLALGEGASLALGAGNSAVQAKVVRHGRGPKIRVFKKKRRKGFRKTRGHRSTYTVVRVTDIVM